MKNESGQSIIEFLLTAPILFGFTVILIRSNVAIQMSIVNQKYDRAQTHFTTQNHAFFPRLGIQDYNVKNEFNQITIGVSDNVFKNEEDSIYEDATRGTPVVSEVDITRPRSTTIRRRIASADSIQSDGKVRIFNSVTLCAHNQYIRSDGQTKRYKSSSFDNSFNARAAFDICGDPYE